MDTKELINNIRDAQHEIRDLRRRNEILSAKVEMFDSMMCILNTQPAYRPQTASPDVVFALDKHVKELADSLMPQPTNVKSSDF